MNINTITAEDLRRMPDKEGLILQGCGGDLTEWVDGINEMLTKAGILKDGCQFENVAAFQHGELTCLLYPFDDVKLDIGKLALWRLQTHEVYGGTWLSDFVPNYLGGFIETPEALADKPDCPLIGADGNIFNLLGIASRTLREHGLKEQAIAFISLIIALACTLVIYSLFYVSIARKTKEYGKLRTIGATGKQMKRIVFREGFHLSKIGIPIGILAGAIAGYVLVPQGWNTLMVFVIAAVTALFVYLCVMIAVIKPAKIAAHVTPIEAVRYMASNNDVMSNSTKVLHRSLSAKNLAFLNFARNRKKTALTILSLGVCGILLMASSAYFNSIDPLAMARRSFPYGEIRLELGDYGPQAHNSEQYSELQKSNLLTEDFRESILDIDGVEEIKEYQGTVLNVRMPTGDIEPIVSDAYTRSSQKLIEQYLIDGTADLQELLKNNGIIIENGPQWKETFGWDAAIGDELLIEVGGQTLEVKVMGIVDANIPYGGYDTLFIPLEMLSKIVPIENLNYQFIVDTDDSKWAAAKDEIQKIIPPTSSLYVSTLNDWVEAYNEKLLNYRMPVYIFVMFIGVFGIINLLNTLITNILTRKRELGVLQAVGLSSKQLSKMLLIEGLFYTLGVLLLSISCGTLIGYLLCTVFSAMSIFGKVSYHFPTVEMFSYFILMLAVQMLFSYLAIRQIKKQSLVDQIRELS